MKKAFLTILILCSSFYLAFPIPKEIEDALKLNRINHFDEALEVIQKALKEERIKPDITSAYTIGRILFRKGELYREISKLKVLTHIGYLLQILAREKEFPDEIRLFLGIGYFYNNQFLDAAGTLNQVVERRAIKDDLLDLSLVYLGASYFKTGEKDKANELWKRVKKENLLAYSTLGYIYAYLDINPSLGESVTGDVIRRGRGKGQWNDSFIVNHAYTLLALGRFDEAYSEVFDVSFDLPVYVYRPDPNKEIRFYDLAMLDSYSKIIFGESIKNLEPIVTASSGELASFASYYVAQMYLYLGKYDKSEKYAQEAKKLSVVTSLTMIQAVSCEASLNFLIGKEKKAKKIIQNEIGRIYGQPSSLLEMMKVIVSSGVEYSSVKDIIDEVEAYIYETEWERTRRDTALLGELSIFSGRYVRALYYLERARDKGNKNRIETNDPTFLLKLSFVYYSKDYFPESLEILFSLGKEFKGIRPLQDAIQSVYSYRQKGIGEAIIE